MKMNGKAESSWSSRLGPFFLIMFVTAINVAAVQSEWITTASSGQDDYIASNAMDGNMGTRWGSGFSDSEWWQVDFADKRLLGGMVIKWEAAYGEKYRITISQNGISWRTIYIEDKGDGRTDLIYFKPVETRFLRIEGIQRGTGWGYSVWEVEFIDADRVPGVSASSQMKTKESDRILDGLPDTDWHSSGDEEQIIDVEFCEPIKTGGIELSWGKDYATIYNIETSGSEDESWTICFKEDNSNGKHDYIYFPATTVNRLRVRCLKSNSGNGYALRELKIKGADEEATPIRYYLSEARDFKPGWFPMWMNRMQEFWTVVGVLGDDQESIFGETGIFEPVKNGFSVLPFVFSDDTLVSWDDVTLYQSMAEDSLPVPSVRWDYGNWKLDISCISFGKPGASSTAVKYRFENCAPDRFKGKLGLAIRPVQLNPTWQHGGMSPMKQVSCVESKGLSSINVDGRTRLFSVTPPDAMGAVPFGEGDIIEYIAKGKLPYSLSAAEPEGKTSAGLFFDLNLNEGETKEIILVYPLNEKSEIPSDWGNPSEKYTDILNRKTVLWHKLLNRFTIDIPESRLIDVLKSNIAYILINKDGPWIKPGPRNYNHSWMRDGSMTSVALLRFGLHKDVLDFLEAFTPMIAESGWVPWIINEGGHPVVYNPNSREGQEYDSQGQYIFVLRQYVDYTGDESVLKEGYPAAMRALHFAAELRKERKTDAYVNDPEKRPYYGILPESNSHEGYYPAMHSYWDDFWLLKGLKDGLSLAKRFGSKEDVDWILKEHEDARKCIYKSILAVIDRDRLPYISGCVEKGDFDATSTAIAVMACDEWNNLPQPHGEHTFDRYYTDFLSRLVPGQEASFTPYEVRTADSFIRMGKRNRALRMLREFTEDSVRPYAWNHMAEVVHGRLRTPSYIGDMPHTWVGSGYVSAVRSIFAYEDNDKLVLAAGNYSPGAFLRGGVKKKPTQIRSIK